LQYGEIDARVRQPRLFNFNSRKARAFREKDRVYIYASYLYIFKAQSRENGAKSSANKKKCIFPSSFCPLLPFSVSSLRALLPLCPSLSRVSAASKNRNARRFCGGNFCPRQRIGQPPCISRMNRRFLLAPCPLEGDHFSLRCLSFSLPKSSSLSLTFGDLSLPSFTVLPSRR